MNIRHFRATVAGQVNSNRVKCVVKATLQCGVSISILYAGSAINLDLFSMHNVLQNCLVCFAVYLPTVLVATRVQFVTLGGVVSNFC